MSFASPIFLLALLLVPLGALAYRYARSRKRRYAVRFPAAATVAAVAVSVPPWRRWLPLALLGAAAVALSVALARPQTTVAVPVERATVMLVMDASRSMQATDVDPDRLSAATGAAENFLGKVPDRLQVGMVGYSTAPHTLQEPTLEHALVEVAIQSLQADGGTATGDALQDALDQIERTREEGKASNAPAAVILLSDGKTTDGSDPIEAARRAGKMNVPVFTVALGTPEGTVPGQFGEPMPVPPDRETLRKMAAASNGRAFDVEDGDRLNTIYERLGSQIGTKQEKQEATATFAGLGLILLAGAAFASIRWRGRLP